MTPMQAYKNDPQLRESFLAEMQWHQDQDRDAPRTYGKRDDPDFKGCGVGCALHSLFRMGVDVGSTGDHFLLEKHLDWPLPLNHLYDGVYESLRGETQKQFPLRFSTAIKSGADLTMIAPQFTYWLLQTVTQPNHEEQAYPADFADLAYRADLADLADIADPADLADLAYRADLADLA